MDFECDNTPSTTYCNFKVKKNLFKTEEELTKCDEELTKVEDGLSDDEISDGLDDIYVGSEHSEDSSESEPELPQKSESN